MLSNQITQNLISKHEERLKNAIDEQGKKLKETSTAEENLLYKQQLANNARISNMKLQDQIDFSTINLTIYQRQETKRWIIANDKNIDEYKPGFGTKLLDSLKFGWKMLEALLVFIVKLWGLFLFGFILYFLIAKFGYLLKIKRNKKQ